MEFNEVYLIVEQPAVTQAHYTDLCRKWGWTDGLQRVRAALSFLNSNAYRGISRSPLSAFPISDIVLLQKSRYYGVDINTAAQLKMFELQDHLQANDELDSSMLVSLGQAIEVYNLLDADRRNDHEIIKITKYSASRKADTLGYDIGYWGGDFFSVICDCAIMPRWHPPAWNDLEEVAQQLKTLNSHLLFDDMNQAVAFREWYIAKDWAETYGEFCIIRVDECSFSNP